MRMRTRFKVTSLSHFYSLLLPSILYSSLFLYILLVLTTTKRDYHHDRHTGCAKTTSEPTSSGPGLFDNVEEKARIFFSSLSLSSIVGVVWLG